MQKNPLNPINSTCLEALYCLKEAGFRVPDDLVKDVRGNQLLTRKADSQLQAKTYPDKKIRYVQLQMKTLDILADCAPEAQALFLLMVLHLGTSGLVSISVEHARMYLRASKRDVISFFAQLKSHGLISTYRPGRPRHSEIYSVCPEYALVGRGKQSQSLWEQTQRQVPVRVDSKWTHVQQETEEDRVRFNHILPSPSSSEEAEDADLPF